MKKIKCKNCNHSWNLSPKDKEPYLCHICGNNNNSLSMKNLIEQQNMTSIWIKKIKEFPGSMTYAFGFFGSTYNFIDVFRQISKDNIAYKDSKHRFYWNQRLKCWFTKSMKSVERAKNEIELITQSRWTGNSIRFTKTGVANQSIINQKKYHYKNETNLSDIERSNIREFWGEPTIKNGIKHYSEEMSSMNDMSLMICPNCFTKLSSENKKNFYTNDVDNEFTHTQYTCTKCNSKITLWND